MTGMCGNFLLHIFSTYFYMYTRLCYVVCVCRCIDASCMLIDLHMYMVCGDRFMCIAMDTLRGHTELFMDRAIHVWITVMQMRD